VSRVDSLGRKGEVEVSADLETVLLEQRQQHLLGRSRVGGALENDELAWTERPGDVPRGGDHVGNVRIPRLPERGRDTDHDRVLLAQDGPIAGRREPTSLQDTPEVLGRHVRDVRLAPPKGGYAFWIGIDPGDPESGPCQLDGERKADVPLPDDGDPG